MYGLPVASKDTLVFDTGIVMVTGDQLYGYADRTGVNIIVNRMAQRGLNYAYFICTWFFGFIACWITDSATNSLTETFALINAA